MPVSILVAVAAEIAVLGAAVGVVEVASLSPQATSVALTTKEARIRRVELSIIDLKRRS